MNRRMKPAGGTLRSDLFSDDDRKARLLDAALPERLAADKLRRRARQVRAETRKWVHVAQLREAAQVGVPERGVDAVAVAALDLALEDAFADARTDESVQQPERRAAHGDDLDERRHQPGQYGQAFEVGRGEAGRVGRRCREHVGHIAPERHRQRHIVGHAVVAQVANQRVLAFFRLRCHAQPVGLAMFQHELDRAADEGVTGACRVLHRRTAGALLACPVHAPAGELGVQGAAHDNQPVDVRAGEVELLREGVDHLRRIVDATPVAEQPARHRFERPAVDGTEERRRHHCCSRQSFSISTGSFSARPAGDVGGARKGSAPEEPTKRYGPSSASSRLVRNREDDEFLRRLMWNSIPDSGRSLCMVCVPPRLLARRR
jgi:hypothetical protein